MNQPYWNVYSFRTRESLFHLCIDYYILECGCQCTGGNFTDWKLVPEFDNLGFPIAEVREDGSMLITKVT